MTPKQDSFIRTLIGERAATLRAMADDGDAKARFLARWNAGEIRSATLDVSKASSAIEWLLTIARDGGETAAAPTADVPAGRYALVAEDGVVKFYVVDRPTEGKWAGRTFVSAQARAAPATRPSGPWAPTDPHRLSTR